ncbi:MAG: PadR family transcriptional regulator [Gemmatimonadetes bacterium]|nr:PadR family transcriptional regulator [Gemmatimonadota bacterium]
MRFDDYLDFDSLPWPFGSSSTRRKRGQRYRRSRWKWFERGDLKFAILALIEEKPMHGYEVMQALEAESAGCYRASPGSVYPTLQLLEDQGHATARDQAGRKIYSITESGRGYLEENREHVEHIFERVSKFSDRIFGRDMSELSRKFSRLARTTFQGAVSWIDDEQLFSDMKGVLDRAVKDMDAAWDAARERRRAAKAARSAQEETAEG